MDAEDGSPRVLGGEVHEEDLVEASLAQQLAEIESAILGALHDGFSRDAQPTTDDLERALSASPPLSVTMRERIARLRSWADGRCVPAD